MALSGQLSDFSMPEILRVIEQGQKTGTLVLWSFDLLQKPFRNRYINFSGGKVVAAADDLSGNNLLTLLSDKQFVDQENLLTLTQAIQKFGLDAPLGNYLQAKKLLDLGQLKTVFELQVLERACALFQLDKGWFVFNPSMVATESELTGLSISPVELSLRGMRIVQQWTNFTDKLPDITSGLAQNNFTGLPHLLALEKKVFESSTGTYSLTKIASRIGIPVEEVQKIAFCLIATGLVEELPMIETKSTIQLNQTSLTNRNMDQSMRNSTPNSTPDRKHLGSTASRTSLINLKNYLREKIYKG